MEFIKTADPTLGIAAVAARLEKELKHNKRVLWLLCGGSGVSAEVQILRRLRENKNIKHLAIMLMDERFGAPGHADSNWQRLVEAGADFTGMYALPVLTDQSLEETVAAYNKLTKTAFDAADTVIGQFGVGADGHTAGVLPNSPAAHNTDKLVVAYEAKPFTRITLTHQALKWVDAAYVFAYGAEKKQALTALKAHKQSFQKLPSTIFWDLPEAHIYNDQIGKAS